MELQRTAVDNDTFVNQVQANVERALKKPPVWADVATEAVGLCKSETVSLDKIDRLLVRDAALMAKVLAVANSPFYRATQRITSVRAAAVRIGLNSLRDVLLQAIAMSQVFNVPRFAARSSGLRLHAIEVAHASRLVAHSLDTKQADDAFTAGLFHDVGKPIILSAIAASPELIARARPEQIDWILNEMHAGVGEMGLRAWGVNPRVATVAGWHQRPDVGTGEWLVDAVVCAHRLVRASERMAREDIGALADEPPFQRVNLDSTQLRGLLDTVLQQRAAARQMAGG